MRSALFTETCPECGYTHAKGQSANYHGIKYILECPQCGYWKREDDGFYGLADEELLQIRDEAVERGHPAIDKTRVVR